MSSNIHRTHILLPSNLLRAIDKHVGKRKRSQFLAEAAREKLERIQLIQALDKAAGAWKIKDHPEFKTQEEVRKWVRESRAEDEKHYRKKARRGTR